MKQIAKIKINKGIYRKGDIIDVLPEDHIFSEKELIFYDIEKVDDKLVETVEEQINEYRKTATALGATPAQIRKYMENGIIKWQTV
jgi:hypothetical protein